ncbi:dihydrolipoamide acetyltransferase [Rubripirellula lacrimiformis]|uniref:Dihydrolipoamide acetyltransferase n=1 Tax=Rubripirellula lacrimiformis TaxID=1930273 RepID=A0A517N7P0_9BACT|nr:HlyD family efflux transporter periplasmic adaptor subunit [Rubripirellula lacrimiformis]QDT03159.1 dihydrolipoamide acetyltransferase [Rubripirellula lacrimiformis]
MLPKRAIQSVVRSTVCLVLGCVLSHSAVADDTIAMDDLIVTVIESIDVPAGRTGSIASMTVREGDSVATGKLIATTDDREARIRQAIAATQLDVARRKIKDGLSTEQAEAAVGSTRQAAKEQEMLKRVANKKATNLVRIAATEKASEVAKNELDRALASRRAYAQSISTSEIEGLRLAYEKSILETQQAKSEHEIEELSAQAETEAAAGHLWLVQQSKLELRQAEVDEKINELNLELARQQTELANLEVLRHQVVSPIDGVVVEIHRRPGDWVTEGEPMVRVIRLNRLRAEGFANLDDVSALKRSPQVNLRIQTAESVVQRSGKIVFVSPEIDPVNKQVRFWVEFDNSDLVVLPGMRLSLELTP